MGRDFGSFHYNATSAVYKHLLHHGMYDIPKLRKLYTDFILFFLHILTVMLVPATLFIVYIIFLKFGP